MKRGMFHTTLNGNDIEIDIRCKPPVQTHFFLAVEMAFFQRRKVKKPEIDSFLDLVDDLSGKNYPRYMRLNQVYSTDRMVIKRGNLQGTYQENLVLRHGITPVPSLHTGSTTASFRAQGV